MKKEDVIVTIIMTIFALILMLASRVAWAEPCDSENEPIIIRTAEQLDNVRKNSDKYFKLGNDIDLTDYLEPGGAGYAKWKDEGWQPIGTSESTFTGGFNGADYMNKGGNKNVIYYSGWAVDSFRTI